MTIATSIPRGFQIAKYHVSAVNSYQVGRTSSVNTAIARGIRKSDGFGTSGRRRSSPTDSREERNNGRFESAPNKSRVNEDASWQRNKTRSDFGEQGERGERGFSRGGQDKPFKQYGQRETRDGPGRRRDFGGQDSRASKSYPSSESRMRPQASQGRSQLGDDKPLVSFTNRTPGFSGPPRSKRSDESFDDRKSRGSRSSRDGAPPSMGTELTEKLNIPYSDRNIPLSIPYTTPASEFLYGTSVVQSALTSTRQPRRKLYKLYILSTPARDDPEQDKKIMALARRAGVTIQRIPSEGVRLLDKMSAGRPHNGYILEASPLPRLPVKSLGAVSKFGFHVDLNHQSKEEAEVNGSDTFISTQKTDSTTSKRHPLILYLDSITDPGNLGGIIRTASFLGISAIAISTRNSAPFSPVVLKASAGASENITIFSVEKPAGFIADSKTAGWKVYAAVAPEKGVDRPSVSAEKLNDPLADDPVILMLGSEGEGLRWNLRSKADIDVYIRGSRARGGVDSLNVSVATGILCNAFLRVPRKSKAKTIKSVGDVEAAVVSDTTASSAVEEDSEEVNEEEEQEHDDDGPSKDENTTTGPRDGNSIF